MVFDFHRNYHSNGSARSCSYIHIKFWEWVDGNEQVHQYFLQEREFRHSKKHIKLKHSIHCKGRYQGCWVCYCVPCFWTPSIKSQMQRRLNFSWAPGRQWTQRSLQSSSDPISTAINHCLPTHRWGSTEATEHHGSYFPVLNVCALWKMRLLSLHQMHIHIN